MHTQPLQVLPFGPPTMPVSVSHVQYTHSQDSLKERANTLFAHAQLPDGFVGKLEAYQVKPVKWSLE